MRRLWLSLVLVTGCGGPDFGPEHAPTAQEQANGQAAEGSLAVFTTDSINADSFGNFANSIYGLANSSYQSGMTALPRGLYADCATITVNRVDFHCNVNGQTVNGYVSRTINGASVAWHVDLSAAVSITSGSTSQSTNMHLGGDVTVTGGAQINGSLSLHATVHIVSDGRTIDATLDSTVSYNKLIYDAAQACITGGNVVVSLDAEAQGRSVSQAVRFTFTGCHMFTVAVAK